MNMGICLRRGTVIVSLKERPRRPLMKTLAGVALAAIAVVFSPFTEALALKCECLATEAAKLQTSPDPKIDCVATYSNLNSEVSVQETQLKVYVTAANLQQSDNDMEIKFRPRDQKCLNAVFDGVSEKEVWRGAHCNNDSAKPVHMSRSNNDSRPQFKPTSGSCINSVEDSAKQTLFDGSYCDAAWKEFDIPMTQTKSSSTAQYKVETDGKHYRGSVLFDKDLTQSNPKWGASAVCVENR
jgi:hypothetical protein